MEVSIGTGSSSKVDGYEAGLEAASAVHEQLDGDAPDFVLVFSTIGCEQEDILASVVEQFGDVRMSGAAFEGVIGRDYADEGMDALQIVGLKSDDVQFHNFEAANAVDQPLEAGEQLGRQVAEITQSGTEYSSCSQISEPI